jgi:hypothetical protein
VLLQNNQFTGALPHEIGNAMSLKVLDLSNNAFAGAIPDSLWKLPFGQGVEWQSVFNLEGNDLSGTVPLDFCSKVEVFSADCGSLFAAGKVVCLCGPDAVVPSNKGVCEREKPNLIPWSDGTFDDRVLGIMTILTSVSGSEALRKKDSDQYRAACWVLYDDTLQLDSTSATLVQRYVWALFYFGSGYDRIDWARERFLASDSECYWYGNECNDDGHITTLYTGKSPTLVRGCHARSSLVVF